MSDVKTMQKKIEKVREEFDAIGISSNYWKFDYNKQKIVIDKLPEEVIEKMAHFLKKEGTEKSVEAFGNFCVFQCLSEALEVDKKMNLYHMRETRRVIVSVLYRKRYVKTEKQKEHFTEMENLLKNSSFEEKYNLLKINNLFGCDSQFEEELYDLYLRFLEEKEKKLIPLVKIMEEKINRIIDEFEETLGIEN